MTCSEVGALGLADRAVPFHSFFFFFFLQLHLQHMEVPGPGAKSELLAASLHHSHSNTGSELHLLPTPQLLANLAP